MPVARVGVRRAHRAILLCDPDNACVRQYAVSVEPGSVLLRGPYVAETFQVAIEENYIVVEM